MNIARLVNETLATGDKQAISDLMSKVKLELQKQSLKKSRKSILLAAASKCSSALGIEDEAEAYLQAWRLCVNELKVETAAQYGLVDNEE